jgi:small-conductance mechanosensitive channel
MLHGSEWFSDVTYFVTAWFTKWGPFLLLILAAFIVGWIFERFVLGLARRAVGRTAIEADDIVLHAVHPAVVFIVFTFTVWLGVRSPRIAVPIAVGQVVDRVGVVILAFLIALTLARLVYALLGYRAKRDEKWMPAASLGGRAGSVVIYIIAGIIVLRYYNVEITPLLTSLGLAGLAVALALQDTLANFFAGVWMQTGRALQPGHYVRLEGTNLEGYVVDIGWRTTKIRQLQNNIIVIPNSKLAQATVIDTYLPEPRMSLLVPVTVGFESDPKQVERILIQEVLRASKKTPGLLAEPKPFVRFIPGFGEYGLQFTLICQVAEYVDQYLAQHEIRKRIIARFRKEGIRIPYPTREQFAVPMERPDVAASRAYQAAAKLNGRANGRGQGARSKKRVRRHR